MDANIASVALVVGAIAATAGGLIKAIVDAVTVVWPDRPRWAPVVMALCGGPVLVLLLQVAAGGAMTAQTVAISILAGLSAGASAIGLTELSTSANLRRLTMGE